MLKVLEKLNDENTKGIGNRVPKGYSFQPFQKPLLRKLCTTSLLASGGVAVADWLWLAGCMYLGLVLFTHYGWLWSAPIHLFILWPLCGRALRGFENLTHEGSHYNFDRKSRGRNDAVANWLCSYWVLISVQMFRKPHESHHRHFGSDEDPDKIRFGRLGLDEMPRRSPRHLAGYLFRVLPVYVIDYWKQFSDKKAQLRKSVAIHTLFAGLMSFMFYENFWLLWLVYFWLPFVIYLPVHRFIAEAEEHSYSNAQTEFTSTYSNLSNVQRWFVHPHGDAYHLLHHMLAQIPHWKLASAHWLLVTLDPTYQSGYYRKSVFDDPRGHFKVVARRIPAIKGHRDESTLRSGTV
jgi:fatty acid desaturase